MEYGKVYLTEEGKKLVAKTLQSKTLKFLNFKVGNGEIDNIESIEGLTDLVNPLLSFNITKNSVENDTQVAVKGLFSNINVTEDFYLKELGLYAKDPDSSDNILFAYVNFGDKAEFITNSSIERKEIYYDLMISVGNSNCVEININSETIYATEKDLENLRKSTTIKKYRLRISDCHKTEKGVIIKLPFYYKTNTDSLYIFLNGEYLYKCESYEEPTEVPIYSRNGSYYEVGWGGEYIQNRIVTSNAIRLTNDWEIESSDKLDVIVIGEVETLQD